MENETKPWGDLSKAKVLIIGHDPRLQNSDDRAEFCFYADYRFSKVEANLKKANVSNS